jgi:hypothetical protein
LRRCAAAGESFYTDQTSYAILRLPSDIPYQDLHSAQGHPVNLVNLVHLYEANLSIKT